MSASKTKGRTTGGHNYENIATAEIARSTFDRSCKHKTTMRASFLIPVNWEEILPGDTINMRTSTFFRLIGLLHPLMDELVMETQTFFVPYRIIWDHYPEFMGEQLEEGAETSYEIPQITCEGGNNRYLYIASYMGVPNTGIDIEVSALPFRAYNKIANDWYRDVNLQDKYPEIVADSGDVEGDYLNIRRCKRKDIFTSCLPWPQRGDPINLLFDGTAPVTATPFPEPFMMEDESLNQSTMKHDPTAGLRDTGVPDSLDANEDISFATGQDTGLMVDFSNASANTINGLRNAFAVQRLLERDARGGARLTEILKSHFKIDSPDGRLQRAEYIGGSKTVMGMQTIHATNQATQVDLGTLAGIGMGHGSGNSMQYSATEHGILMTIASVRAPQTYQTGLPRKFSRLTRFDHFWPAFSHVGELPILNKEVYAQGTDDLAADAGVFGYNEAWCHYRSNNDMVTGLLQSGTIAPLDSWHLAQDFTSLPTLGDAFIEDLTTSAVDRATISEFAGSIIAEFHFDIKHTRPMPTFSTPGLIDHF